MHCWLLLELASHQWPVEVAVNTYVPQFVKDCLGALSRDESATFDIIHGEMHSPLAEGNNPDKVVSDLNDKDEQRRVAPLAYLPESLRSHYYQRLFAGDELARVNSGRGRKAENDRKMKIDSLKEKVRTSAKKGNILNNVLHVY